MRPVRGSVIIPSWNAAKVLRPCLDSLDRQEFPGGFETIVVDNGSTDGTAELLRERADRVRAIHNERNLGYSGGNNQGAQVARGRVLFLFNSDLELLHSDTLDRLARAAEEPGVGLAGPLMLNPDRTLQPCCAAHPSIARSLVVGAGLQRVMPQRVLLRLAPEFWSHDRPVDTGWLLGAALAIPADVFHRLGGFWSTEYAEDEDLAFRVQRLGLKVRFEPAAQVVHVGNFTLGQHRNDVQRGAKVAAAELAFLRTHYSRPRAAAIRTIVRAGYAARGVVHGLLGNAPKAELFRTMAREYSGARTR
jgi:GT2 family glycosyltransferase